MRSSSSVLGFVFYGYVDHRDLPELTPSCPTRRSSDRPPDGDWGRHVGVVRGEHSALSIAYNAGKRGLCRDARAPRGKALLGQLARQADVLIQNFRPGVAARIGADYAELAADRPDLVYVSISGYGQDGPYANAPASDSVMQADSGLMAANQSPD